LEHAYKLSEASALISQSERMRAEILIQKGDLGEAEKAAVKALEVAEKIGENLEKGAALRVLGEIAGLKHELDHGQRLILRAIDAIRGSSARYDLARAYISAYQLHRGNVGQSQYYLQLARELYAAMKLDFSLSRVLPRSEESRARYEVASPSGEIISIVSVNRRVKAIMRAVEAIKDSDIPILIGGETGTGKDQLAKYIHYSSRRRGGNFIVVNCAAIPPDLAESELFGYVRGAFTNAAETRDGLIAAANGGTLFLNEIGELRPAIQAKLLGVLENRKVLRIGDLLPRPADFRLICATNRDLEEEVRSGAFRQDLFFRIAVMTFELPPLAQRGDDVCELIMHFLKEKGFEITAQDIYGNQDIHAGLLKYDWPGNIRELRNEISLLALSYPGDTRMVLSKLCEKLSNEANQTKIDRESGLAEQLSAFERMKILEALAQSDYVIRKAAQLLKMPEATLRSKIKRHKINIA